MRRFTSTLIVFKNTVSDIFVVECYRNGREGRARFARTPVIRTFIATFADALRPSWLNYHKKSLKKIALNGQ